MTDNAALTSEKHELLFDDFDLRVSVKQDGKIWISFQEFGKCAFSCDWDTFRECMDFIGTHGLKIENPWFGAYVETVEGAEEAHV